MQECISPVLHSEVLGGDALSLDRGAFKAMRAFQFKERGRQWMLVTSAWIRQLSPPDLLELVKNY